MTNKEAADTILLYHAVLLDGEETTLGQALKKAIEVLSRTDSVPRWKPQPKEDSGCNP